MLVWFEKIAVVFGNMISGSIIIQFHELLFIVWLIANLMGKDNCNCLLLMGMGLEV